MMKPLAFFLLLSVLLVSVSAIAYKREDPELTQCKESCELRRLPKHLQEECKDRCERDAQQQKQDPQQEYRECQKQCERESEQEKCERQCKEQLEERQGRGDNSQQDENPYVFQDQHFQTISAQHGRLRILPKFSDHSKLLQGFINNFRFAYLEANPQTFMLPNHLDAEIIIVVVQGNGRISLVRSEGRQSVNLKRGDIFRVPAGTTAYMINKDKNEKLILAKLIQPVSTPGEFEAFFGAGAKNPESFLRSFSPELLEAAFNVKRDRLQSWLDNQKDEFIVKASEEQIRALTEHGEESGKSIWPFGGESRNKINLFDQRPVQSNKYGELREVNPSDFKQLEDLDVSVSFANITKGGMSTIFFNSKSAKLSVVTNGKGRLEMACPHLADDSEQGSGSSQKGQGGSQESQQGQGGSQEQERQSYEKVEADLRKGVVFITPPGHPFTMVASNNQNLEVLCFEINARNNERTPLAGKSSIFKQMEKEAKELSFNIPSGDVDKILKSQNDEWFFRGPRQQQQDLADQ